jgi:hypothetical protein
MPLDPSIILGAKPVQIDMAQFSPMNALTSAMKLRQLDQEGELNALTLGERKNLNKFLPGKDLSDPEVRYQLASQFGEAGRKIAAGVTAIGTAETTEKKRRIDTAVEKSKMYNNMLMDVTDQRGALQWIQDQKQDPDMAASPIANVSIMDAASKIPADPAGFAQWKQQAALGLGKYIELNKPVISQVNRGGQTDILSRPGLGGALTTVGNYPDVPLPAEVEAQNLRKAAAARPVTNVNVSTEKKYGEKLAGNIADRDDAKLGAAEKAPELAASANRIIDLVKQGNVFTGPIANIKLNIARGLNVVGANNEEKIANTEMTIAATGQSTLDAIKGAGLGTGQGFTDNVLKFLQGIAGGTIEYTPQSLTRLATLQHQAATRSVQAWNTRFKDIPKSSIEGMGLRTAPDVPPLSAATSNASRPPGVGSNWTYESDASGNKAWVSPDRKSFKEAK